MNDLIVVGAGPAGSATAKASASLGMDVALLDAREFPREKLCGGVLTPRAVSILESAFGGIEYPFVPSNSLKMGVLKGYSLEDIAEITGNREIVRFIDRRSFDHALVKDAIESGASFVRERIRSVEKGEDCFTVRGSGSEFRSRFLVIAAGSFGCRLLRAEEQPEFGVVYTATVPKKDHVPKLAFFEQGYGWVFPGPNRVSIGVGKHPDYGRLSIDYARRLISLLGGQDETLCGGVVPVFSAERSLELNRIEDGCLFVGDAGGFVDPWTGEGIGFALDSGISAASAISRGFGEPGEVNKEFLGNVRQIAKHLLLGDALRKGFFGNMERSIQIMEDPKFSRMAIVFTGRYCSRVSGLMLRSLLLRGIKVRKDETRSS